MAATHAALIDAALDEFGLHGLDASLDGICARAGLTRGAFYVHFSDREALIRAAVAHVLGGFVQTLTALEPGSGATARAIRMFIAAARARSPAVHGGRKLRFFHLLDACYRSRAVGDDYRRLVLDARDRIALGLGHDRRGRGSHGGPAPEALADLLAVAALGIVAALELELPIDLVRLGDTMLALLSS
jgi:TetR/AcrR family transcriptional regulator, transcriptional repressor for nem operon